MTLFGSIISRDRCRTMLPEEGCKSASVLSSVLSHISAIKTITFSFRNRNLFIDA